MLNALRQIEAKHPQASQALGVVSAEELARFGLNRPAMPWSRSVTRQETAAVEPEVSVEEPAVKKPVEEEPAAPATVDEPAPPRLLSVVPELAEDETPPSEFDPQYTDLADKILARRGADRSQTLLFTSPADGEGKTSTLAPLAIVLAARLGEDVLLVDANFRQPDLTQVFGLSVGLGLADVLAGIVQWPEVIRKTSEPHLDVLPGNRVTVENDWSLEPQKFAALVKELRGHYRLVLLDTPSLHHPFATLMAAHCQGTYLLARLGHTDRHEIRQAVRLLGEHDAQLLGCIVTK
jgi:Mrp family chromosome partitioning ATPase